MWPKVTPFYLDILSFEFLIAKHIKLLYLLFFFVMMTVLNRSIVIMFSLSSSKKK